LRRGRDTTGEKGLPKSPKLPKIAKNENLKLLNAFGTNRMEQNYRLSVVVLICGRFSLSAIFGDFWQFWQFG
jgi:hypothetical protein